MELLLDDNELLQKVANGIVLERKYVELAEEYENDTSRSKITIAMRCLRLATEYIKEHQEEVEEEKAKYKSVFNSREFFSMGLFYN